MFEGDSEEDLRSKDIDGLWEIGDMLVQYFMNEELWLQGDPIHCRENKVGEAYAQRILGRLCLETTKKEKYRVVIVKRREVKISHVDWESLFNMVK